MNEYRILWIAVGSLLGLVVASAMYALGGRSNKWIRRYLASFVLTLTVILSSIGLGTFTWWSLLTYPLLVLTFCLGYGAASLRMKILKRGLVVLASLLSTLPLILTTHSLVVLPIHMLMGVAYIYMGVRNPIPAAAEETFICAILNMSLLIYPFIGVR